MPAIHVEMNAPTIVKRNANAMLASAMIKNENN